jgi:hypothetical protein
MWGILPNLYDLKGEGGKRDKTDRTSDYTARKTYGRKRVDGRANFTSEKAIRRTLRVKESHEPQVTTSITAICRNVWQTHDIVN